MVGHTERFNPAVTELQEITTDPVHIEARRISPYTPRIDDGVVLDLMIHDLDIAQALARSPVTGVEAIATRKRSSSEDLAVAMLQFESGATAVLTASRLGQQKIRELAITQSDSYLTADLIRQDVTIHRISKVSYSDGGQARYSQAGVVEIPFLSRRGEPAVSRARTLRRVRPSPVSTPGVGARWS